MAFLFYYNSFHNAYESSVITITILQNFHTMYMDCIDISYAWISIPKITMFYSIELYSLINQKVVVFLLRWDEAQDFHSWCSLTFRLHHVFIVFIYFFIENLGELRPLFFFFIKINEFQLLLNLTFLHFFHDKNCG